MSPGRDMGSQDEGCEPPSDCVRDAKTNRRYFLYCCHLKKMNASSCARKTGNTHLRARAQSTNSPATTANNPCCAKAQSRNFRVKVANKNAQVANRIPSATLNASHSSYSRYCSDCCCFAVCNRWIDVRSCSLAMRKSYSSRLARRHLGADIVRRLAGY